MEARSLRGGSLAPGVVWEVCLPSGLPSASARLLRFRWPKASPSVPKQDLLRLSKVVLCVEQAQSCYIR